MWLEGSCLVGQGILPGPLTALPFVSLPPPYPRVATTWSHSPSPCA